MRGVKPPSLSTATTLFRRKLICFVRGHCGDEQADVLASITLKAGLRAMSFVAPLGCCKLAPVRDEGKDLE
eukprot:3113434-Alexandrium_andersonii.AAC.1